MVGERAATIHCPPIAWVHDLGGMDYRAAWAVQQEVHQRVLRGDWPPTILFVEHPPVITLGKRGRPEHILADARTLRARGVQVVQSDRGGEVTFHGPGQLVVYPILPLALFHLGPSSYVHLLEAVVIEALAGLGLAAATDRRGVGVWVGGRKIAAVGVRVRRGVTLHGVALNIFTDLSYFDLIVPCGLAGRVVTNIQEELSCLPDRQTIRDLVLKSFRRHFGCRSGPIPQVRVRPLAADFREANTGSGTLPDGNSVGRAAVADREKPGIIKCKCRRC